MFRNMLFNKIYFLSIYSILNINEVYIKNFSGCWANLYKKNQSEYFIILLDWELVTYLVGIWGNTKFSAMKVYETNKSFHWKLLATFKICWNILPKFQLFSNNRCQLKKFWRIIITSFNNIIRVNRKIFDIESA